MIPALSSPLLSFSQMLPSSITVEKGMNIAQSCMKAIVPTACVYDFLQGTRLFTMGSWSMASSLGLFALYLPSLLKKGDETVQEWIFERLKWTIDSCDVESYLFFLGLLRDVNRTDKDGNSLLHYFLIRKRIVKTEMIVALKKRGANPFARNKNREMALYRGRSVVSLLLLFFDLHGPVFQKCKTIKDLCEILFPPSRGSLPPNSEQLQAKLGDLSILQNFTDELSSQVGRLAAAPSFKDIEKEMDAIDTASRRTLGRPLTVKEFAKKILEICPLYKWLYEQAKSPDIKQENSDSIHFQKGAGGFYDTSTHSIHIGPKNFRHDFYFLIFETCNAFLKDILLRVSNLEDSGEISPEEGVFLREFVEHKTCFCCASILQGLKFDYPKPKKFEEHWINSNKPGDGFMAHADTYRTIRNILPYLEKNPRYLKRRLAAVNQGLI